MKIGNSYGPALSGNDLIERMQHAHEQASAHAIDRCHEDRAAHTNGTSRRPLSPHRPAASSGASPLDSRMLALARSAIDGRYSSAGQLREAVVAVIVDQRYPDLLPESDRASVMNTLHHALACDPAFCAEVDNMLVLAAQHLGDPHMEP